MEFTLRELKEIYECLGFTNDECCGTDLSYELEYRIGEYLKYRIGEYLKENKIIKGENE